MLRKFVASTSTEDLCPYEDQKELERAAKQAAFFAVVVSTSAVFAGVIGLPLFYSYALRVQSFMQNESDFCKMKTRDLWTEILSSSMREGMDAHSRVARKAFWSFGRWFTENESPRSENLQLGGYGRPSPPLGPPRRGPPGRGPYGPQVQPPRQLPFQTYGNLPPPPPIPLPPPPPPVQSCCTCHQGPAGSPGQPGSPGTDGDDGFPGVGGEPGPPGDPGFIPPRPTCAPQICGPAAPGRPGHSGPPGFPGPRGPPGNPGRTLRDSPRPGPPGPPGPGGRPGTKGPPGPNGQMDTGVPPTMPRGPPGFPGPPGLPGQPGSDGFPAQTGAPGPLGDPGDSGTPGGPGPQGPPGPPGNPGGKGSCDHCPNPRVPPGW